MFTVKHTSPSYSETLYTASEVRFEPTGDFQTASDPTPETVWVTSVEKGSVPLTDGVVYVMNDNGATVAKYDLELKNQGPQSTKGIGPGISMGATAKMW